MIYLRSVLSFLVHGLLLSSASIYVLIQYQKIEGGNGSFVLSSAAYGITGSIIVIIGILTLVDKKISRRAKSSLSNNKYILLYSLAIFVGQSINVLAGDSQINDLVLGGAYAVAALSLFYVLPVVVYEYRFISSIVSVISWLGVAIGITGVYGSLYGADSILGLTIRNKIYMEGLGAYVTAGVMHNPNPYGIFCVISVLSALYAYRINKKNIYLYLTIFNCLAVIVSFSRYANLSLGAVLLLEAIYYYDLRRTRLPLLLFCSLLVVVFIGQVFVFNNLLYVLFTFELFELAERAYLWPAALEAMLERPVRGYGFTGSDASVAIFEAGGWNVVDAPGSSHNSFLDLGVRGGVLVFGFYLFSTFKSFVNYLYSDVIYNYVDKMLFRYFASLSLITVGAAVFSAYSMGGLGFIPLMLAFSTGMISLASTLR